MFYLYVCKNPDGSRWHHFESIPEENTFARFQFAEQLKYWNAKVLYRIKIKYRYAGY